MGTINTHRNTRTTLASGDRRDLSQSSKIPAQDQLIEDARKVVLYKFFGGMTGEVPLNAAAQILMIPIEEAQEILEMRSSSSSELKFLSLDKAYEILEKGVSLRAEQLVWFLEPKHNAELIETIGKQPSRKFHKQIVDDILIHTKKAQSQNLVPKLDKIIDQKELLIRSTRQLARQLQSIYSDLSAKDVLKLRKHLLSTIAKSKDTLEYGAFCLLFMSTSPKATFNRNLKLDENQSIGNLRVDKVLKAFKIVSNLPPEYLAAFTCYSSSENSQCFFYKVLLANCATYDELSERMKNLRKILKNGSELPKIDSTGLEVRENFLHIFDKIRLTVVAERLAEIYTDFSKEEVQVIRKDFLNQTAKVNKISLSGVLRILWPEAKLESVSKVLRFCTNSSFFSFKSHEALDAFVSFPDIPKEYLSAFSPLSSKVSNKNFFLTLLEKFDHKSYLEFISYAEKLHSIVKEGRALPKIDNKKIDLSSAEHSMLSDFKLRRPEMQQADLIESVIGVYTQLKAKEILRIKNQFLEAVASTNKISKFEAYLLLWPKTTKKAYSRAMSSKPLKKLLGLEANKLLLALNVLPEMPREYLLAFSSEVAMKSAFKKLLSNLSFEDLLAFKTKTEVVAKAAREETNIPEIDVSKITIDKSIVAPIQKAKEELEKNKQLEIISGAYASLNQRQLSCIRKYFLEEAARVNQISPLEVFNTLWPYGNAQESYQRSLCLHSTVYGFSDKFLLAARTRLPSIPVEYLLAFSSHRSGSYYSSVLSKLDANACKKLAERIQVVVTAASDEKAEMPAINSQDLLIAKSLIIKVKIQDSDSDKTDQTFPDERVESDIPAPSISRGIFTLHRLDISPRDGRRILTSIPEFRKLLADYTENECRTIQDKVPLIELFETNKDFAEFIEEYTFRFDGLNHFSKKDLLQIKEKFESNLYDSKAGISIKKPVKVEDIYPSESKSIYKKYSDIYFSPSIVKEVLASVAETDAAELTDSSCLADYIPNDFVQIDIDLWRLQLQLSLEIEFGIFLTSPLSEYDTVAKLIKDIQEPIVNSWFL